MEKLTKKEYMQFKKIEQRIYLLATLLKSKSPPKDFEATTWYDFLNEIKNIQGNFYNDISFIATLLAKDYLVRKFDIQDFDAAEKAQGASGFDIDLLLNDGEQIVGEIKTTCPYKEDDLGAQQLESFMKDFRKLHKSNAKYKYFFVTERKTFDILKKTKYKQEISEIQVVLLTSGG